MTWRAPFTRICPACLQPFHPSKREIGKYTETCSMRCRGVMTARRQRGKPVHPATTAGCRLKYLRRVEAATRELFGPLSKREIEVFNYAMRLGLRRGGDRRRRAERRAA